MRAYRIFAVLLFVALYTDTHAQQTTLIGKVIDSETGSPLSYANIRIKEKPLGAAADIDGQFTLIMHSPSESYTLVFSFIGYTTQEIKVIEFLKRTDKVIKLEPEAHQLETITVSDGKFDVNEFMAEVIRNYKLSSRKTPHIAQAYFQEQVNVKHKPVLFVDGIGYSIYMGEVENQSARSNYKFLYEQVSVNRDYQGWTNYLRTLGKTTDHRFGASDNLNNFRTFELNGPLSGNHKKFKYSLAVDSILHHQGQECLYIKFNGAHQSGWMIIGEESFQVWMIAYNDSKNIWSNAYNERVKGSFVCIYDYYDGQHFLSETHSFYTKGDIIHWSKLKVLSQKFDKLALSELEYWAINSLDLFTIGEAKEIDTQFEPHKFSVKDQVQRSAFNDGFKNLTIDEGKHPDYTELLSKLRAYF